MYNKTFKCVYKELGKIEVGNFTPHSHLYGKITPHFILTPLTQYLVIWIQFEVVTNKGRRLLKIQLS